MKSSPFDDDDGLDEEEPQLLESSIWRRPWWRRNLFTLFGILFVLVWIRELFQWSAPTALLSAIGILLVWWGLPTGLRVINWVSRGTINLIDNPRFVALAILFARLVALLFLVSIFLQVRSIIVFLSNDAGDGAGKLGMLLSTMAIVTVQLGVSLLLWRGANHLNSMSLLDDFNQTN